MIALLILCSVPLEVARADTVDVIEVNHVYDESGRFVFSQAIYWDWNGCRYECRDWKYLKCGYQVPHKTAQGFRSTWNDEGKLRDIRANHYRETWTNSDPEIIDRDILKPKNRKRLAK